MPYPVLIQKDHEGSDYCPGFTDVFGKWNTGFYCPRTEAVSAVFCCGTSYVKYCCTTQATLEEEDEDHHTGTPEYHVRVPIFFAVFCGILAVVILLITAICFFCSCCFAYKKRRNAASTGLYRIQGSSSTVSALASIYSNQNNSSVVTTPLDSDWTLSTLPISSYPTPYPFSQSITSSASAFTPYRNSNLSPVSAAAVSNFSASAVNNNNVPNFYYNNLTPRNVNTGQLPSLYSHGNHLNQRPLSALSTISRTTNASSSNSTFSFGRQYPRQNSTLLQPQSNAYGFPTANNLPLSQQAFVYRPQIATLRNSTIGQTHGSLRAPFSISTGTNGLHQTGQNHVVQHNSTAGTPYGNRVVQNNTYQQRQNSNSLPYESNNNGGPGGGNGLVRSSNRTQGNLLNQQQQQLNQIIFAAIQNLIGSYRGSNGGPNAFTPPSQTTASGSRPNSLSSSDINRLNAINLRLSTLNQNIRSGDNRPNTESDGGNNSNESIPLPIHSNREDSGKETEMTSRNEESVNQLPPSSNIGDSTAKSPALEESQSSNVISDEESTENRVSSSLDGDDKKTAEESTETRSIVPSCNSEGSGESTDGEETHLGQCEITTQPVDSYGSIEVGIHKDGESEPTTANILEPDKISILAEKRGDQQAEPNNVNDSMDQENKEEDRRVTVTEQNQVKKAAEIQELLCDARLTDCEVECT